MPPLNRDPIATGGSPAAKPATGRDYWRSLEELAGTEQFQEMLHREFPVDASVWDNAVSRRRFLTLMGASLALAGLSGCGTRAPAEKIVPYVKEPEGMIPGKPLFFATAMPLADSAVGLLVESHMGRPTKVEGNPDHPASLGATDGIAQASILNLYDPDREQVVTYLGKVRTWDDTLDALREELAKLRQDNEKAKRKPGEGLYLLAGAVSSPTLAAQLNRVVGGKEYEGVRWHQFEPAVSDTPREGARLAFGREVQPHYHIDKADVILSLDADFLSCGPGHLRYVREFSRRRTSDPKKMNRLYVAESMFTVTGASADHHLPLRAGDVETLARAIAARLGVEGIQGDAPIGTAKWADVVARDLKRAGGAGLVIPGDGQPAAVHALTHAMNRQLGNWGKTVAFTRPVVAPPPTPDHSIGQLARDMADGKVKVLFLLGCNPVYAAPADLDFAAKMDGVPLRIHLGPYFDETSTLCHWHIPEAHYLETWSDTRTFDGTATIMQPLIAPLYQGRSAHELLSGLFDPSPLTGHDLVRSWWRTWWEGHKERSGTFESFWTRSLHDGVVPGSAFEPEMVSLRANFAAGLPAAGKPAEGLELVFRPDPALFDGRFANNGWLQEWPRPLTRLTWDNAAIMSPKTARALGVTYPVRIGNRGGEHGEAYPDMVTLEADGRKLTLPSWILPGHADDSITLHLGFGRTVGGRVASGAGFSAYQLRTSAQPWRVGGVTVTRTGKEYLVACVQGHWSMEGRDLVRSNTVAGYEEKPNFAREPDEPHHARPKPGGQAAEAAGSKEEAAHGRKPLTLFPPHEYTGHKWGMVINLSACIGCGACVLACQAENNIPVVGKEEVTRGREMHWLRVDRYFQGEPDEGTQLQAFHQPVPCMQCENAPCEQVCPVAATVHSFDGLNDMVYNRCVGTRYCSNNCPYKVRRFNFLQYSDYTTPSLKLMHNPEVTVRSRGVMEKCTYCVQRIRAAEITAQRENRPLVNGQDVSLIRDGEVLTACQAVCPAQAIVFGDLSGPDRTGRDGSHSQVAKLTDPQESPLNYSLLAELNTRPRTTYLAALRNPNPELG
jgi:molybdopterin-containing oxidoreductase family iron-sulfur binding subunit